MQASDLHIHKGAGVKVHFKDTGDPLSNLPDLHTRT